MLTRPLAYKGPTDHLSQHFSMPQLYAGMGILLDDLLVEWQFDQLEQRAEGFFLEEGKIGKTLLSWPLKEQPEADHCDCEEFRINSSSDCRHLAALAIETKTRLEKLPPPLKQQNNFRNETSYLSQWLSEQHFDPFPNMARHRVVYLLDDSDDVIQVGLHKAYLTQQNEYQRKESLELASIDKKKLPKFISLTDQQIMRLILDQIGDSPKSQLDEHIFSLAEQSSGQILKLIVNSGRCFWRSCHRQPLGWHLADAADESWLPLGENCYLDKSGSRIVEIVSSDIDELEKVKTALAQQSSESIKPKINVSSESLYFSWQHINGNQSPVLELDIAKVSFQVEQIEFGLKDFLRWQAIESKLDKNVAEHIASHLHLIDWLPGIGSRFESPVWQLFDVADRHLEGDFSHWFVLLRGLQKEGWEITFDKQFRLNEKSVEKWYSRVTGGKSSTENAQQSDWFDLELGVVVDGHSINVLPYIVEAIKRGQWQQAYESDQLPQDLTITLVDGTRIVLDGERLAGILSNLVELAENQPLNTDEQLRLPANQFARLSELETQIGGKTQWQKLDWLKAKAKRLSKLSQPKSVDAPENVYATLRQYQHQGLAWLQLLRQENLAGILADDMGLGKTLQTLAHLQIEKNSGRMKSPSIVVAPTSLLGNWIAEAKRFTPDLKVVMWAGGKRMDKVALLEGADLIVTSYGILMRDIEILDNLNLYMLVLDEAQTIKNARSRIAKLTYSMHAQHRLCLTGTPLENHLGELWSLFHFLMPGFLGDEAQFKRLFQVPIEKENNRIRQKALSQRIGPFMLRRTKAKVATDLPPKSEILEYIELTQSQADQYETVRLAMMEEVQKALAMTGLGKNQLLIGNALLRLRQICCHTGLVQGQLFDDETDASAKLNWLITTLPEMIESGQKILLFSSFTSMLDLIAETLQHLKIDFLQLTGKTRNRSELVEKFQAGEADVFLISLKAGGAGLNLTRADTVIHFDPWWNPAAESQASDRAHRIGQDKPVFIYKLITKGTVEERIQEMQQRKADLAEKLYKAQAEENQFERADWETLLAPIDDYE